MGAARAGWPVAPRSRARKWSRARLSATNSVMAPSGIGSHVLVPFAAQSIQRAIGSAGCQLVESWTDTILTPLTLPHVVATVYVCGEENDQLCGAALTRQGARNGRVSRHGHTMVGAVRRRVQRVCLRHSHVLPVIAWMRQTGSAGRQLGGSWTCTILTSPSFFHIITAKHIRRGEDNEFRSATLAWPTLLSTSSFISMITFILRNAQLYPWFIAIPSYNQYNQRTQ